MFPLFASSIREVGSSGRGDGFRRGAGRVFRLAAVFAGLGLGFGFGSGSGLTAGVAAARDHVLILGGGPGLENSEVSLERNVLYFQEIRDRIGLGPDRAEVAILFGAGEGNEDFDVRFDVADRLPPLHSALIRLNPGGGGFGPAGATAPSPTIDFKHHEIPDVAGPCRRSLVFETMADLARRLEPGDRLLIYMTGHGGEGKPTSNGHFYCWGNERINAREFAGALDAFHPEVEVFAVMVQCYSGCFANIVFRGGDPANGLAEHRRAGVFASLETLTAAGCSPDTRIENYREFSTDFWAALAGRDRLGRVVAQPDLNGDGRVDVGEAYAHVVANSRTIDVPARTSDALVRALIPAEARERALEVLKSRTLAELIAEADPAESRMLAALSADLGLDPGFRAGDLKPRMDRVGRRREEGRRPLGRAEREVGSARQAIVRDLHARYPFLRSPWHPRTIAAIATEDAAILGAITGHPRYEDWMAKRAEAERLREAELEAERETRRLTRVERLVETIALTRALRETLPAEELAPFEDLRRREAGFLSVPIETGAGASGAR